MDRSNIGRNTQRCPGMDSISCVCSIGEISVCFQEKKLVTLFAGLRPRTKTILLTGGKESLLFFSCSPSLLSKLLRDQIYVELRNILVFFLKTSRGPRVQDKNASLGHVFLISLHGCNPCKESKKKSNCFMQIEITLIWNN